MTLIKTQKKTKKIKQKQNQKVSQKQNIEINITQLKSKSRGYKPRLQNIEKEQPRQQQQTISNIPIPIPIPVYNQMPSQLPSQYIRQEEGISELLKQLLKTTTQPIAQPIAQPITQPLQIPLMQRVEPINQPVPFIQRAEPIIPIDNRPGNRIPSIRPQIPQIQQPISRNYNSNVNFESDSDSDFFNVKPFSSPKQFQKLKPESKSGSEYESDNQPISTRVIERIRLDVIPPPEIIKTINKNIPTSFLPEKNETLLNTINRDNNLDTLEKLNLFNPPPITLSVNSVTNIPDLPVPVPFEGSNIPDLPVPFEDSNIPTTVKLKQLINTSNDSLLQKIANDKKNSLNEQNNVIKEAQDTSKIARLEAVEAMKNTRDAENELTRIQQDKYIEIENKQKNFNSDYINNPKLSESQNNAKKELINIMYENQKNILKGKTNYPKDLNEIYEIIKNYNNRDVKITSPTNLDVLLESYFKEYTVDFVPFEKAKEELELKKIIQDEIIKTSLEVEKNTEKLTNDILQNRDEELLRLQEQVDKIKIDEADKEQLKIIKAAEDAAKAEEIKRAKEFKIVEDFEELRKKIADGANSMKNIDLTKLTLPQKDKYKISEDEVKLINKFLKLKKYPDIIAKARLFSTINDFLNKTLISTKEINI